MSNTLLFVPLGLVLGLGTFVAFWCLVVKLLASRGWQRLAEYEAQPPTAGSHTMLGRARLGGIGYKNGIRARAQAEGLSLKPLFMFRIGHPPLLIPWSAIGPLQAEKSFWTTDHSTTIRTSTGESVSFSFTDDYFAAEMQAWLGVR